MFESIKQHIRFFFTGTQYLLYQLLQRFIFFSDHGKKKKHVWLVIPPVILKEILKIALKLSAIHFFFIHVSKTKHMD